MHQGRVTLFPLPVGERHHDEQRGQGEHEVEERPVVGDAVGLVRGLRGVGGGGAAVGGLGVGVGLSQGHVVRHSQFSGLEVLPYR